MSVRINLLPDQKVAKIRAARSRQVAAALATLVCSISIGSVVVLLVVSGAQRLTINNLNNDIAEAKAELDSIDGLPEAVTAQLHLNSLVNLYQTRTNLSQFFKVMETVAPVSDFGLTQVRIEENEIKVTGRARSYVIIDKFAKALAASNIEVGEGAKKTNQPFFTEVKLTEGTLSESDSKVGFSLQATMSGEVTQQKTGGNNGN